MDPSQHTSVQDTVHASSDGQDIAPRIPSGFRVKQYAGRDYIVPEFLSLSTEQAIAAIEQRDDRNVDEVR
jgi:hypothetical protein